MREAFEKRKDGTIRMVVRDVEYILRRPTLGEMRKRNEAWDADVVDYVREADTVSQLDDRIISWVRDTVRELAGREPEFDPVDELPPWIVNQGIGAQIILHWRTLP